MVGVGVGEIVGVFVGKIVDTGSFIKANLGQKSTIKIAIKTKIMGIILGMDSF